MDIGKTVSLMIHLTTSLWRHFMPALKCSCFQLDAEFICVCLFCLILYLHFIYSIVENIKLLHRSYTVVIVPALLLKK